MFRGVAAIRYKAFLAHRKAGRRSFYSLCTCSSLELIVQVLDDAQLADEFRADDAGYQAAMEKRRQESRSYFDRVAAALPWSGAGPQAP